ncbi:MAG: hypothetical protein ACETVQ_03875 [Candidatus Bathyarchaeia archaeon]
MGKLEEKTKKEVITGMNLRKIRSRKALKFLGLLISSLLIAAVSATTYRYLYIDGSIKVTSAKMIWIEGADAENATIQGSTAIVRLDVEEGTPVNFTEALFLKNNNASGYFNYTITITQAVSSGDFQRAKMHVYENYTTPWTYLDTLDLTNSTDSYSDSLDGQDYLRMTFEVNATATSGTFDFDIQVEYWRT